MPSSILLLSLLVCGWSSLVLTDVDVTSFSWYHNSKDFCLSLSKIDAKETMFTVESAILTFSYGTYSQTTVNVTAGDHICHNHRPSKYVCGLLPNEITEHDTIIPELFEAELHLHGRNANQEGARSVNISLTHLPESNAKTSALSLRDPCLLYEGVCLKCRRSCHFLIKGMNAIKCDGNRMTKKVRKTLRVIGDDDLPFLMEMERIVDVTNRKIICVVMMRPVHRLGNVWRYLRYIFNQFVLVYTDETNMVRHQDVLHSDVCKNILPMQEESDTATYCSSYSFKPMYVMAITGALGVQSYNVVGEKYVMSPQAIYTGEDFNVSVQHVNVPDGCKDINCSTGSQCIQSCQQIYSSNDYYCKETNSGMAILHEGTTHVQLPTTTTIVLGGKSKAPRGKSADDSTTLPYESGEMDENYKTSEYSTSTTADVETNSVITSLHEGTTHVQSPIITTTIVPGGKSNATGGKSVDDSTTLPYESGEMDEKYKTSEYYTSTTADMETNGKAQAGTGEKSVNSSRTRQPDTSEMNGSLTTSTTPNATIGEGIHEQSSVGTTDRATEGKIQSGNSADISSTKGQPDKQQIKGSFIRSTTEVITTDYRYTTANLGVKRQEDEIPSLVKEQGKIHNTTKKLRKPFIYSNAASTRRACFPSIITFLILNMFHRFYNDF